MKKATECLELKCYANKGAHCKILCDSITGRPCPFMKTGDQLNEGRKAAMERLKSMSRNDLIEKYVQNEKAYRI